MKVLAAAAASAAKAGLGWNGPVKTSDLERFPIPSRI
jgi:hypothetical protein